MELEGLAPSGRRLGKRTPHYASPDLCGSLLRGGSRFDLGMRHFGSLPLFFDVRKRTSVQMALLSSSPMPSCFIRSIS